MSSSVQHVNCKLNSCYNDSLYIHSVFLQESVSLACDWNAHQEVNFTLNMIFSGDLWGCFGTARILELAVVAVEYVEEEVC